MTNVGEIPSILSDYSATYAAVGSAADGLTAYYWIPNLDPATFAELQQSSDVLYVYYYANFNENTGDITGDDVFQSKSRRNETVPFDQTIADANMPLASSKTVGGEEPQHTIQKRTATSAVSNYFHLSMISFPRTGNYIWDTSQQSFTYYYDDSAGAGMNIYGIFQSVTGPYATHPEFSTNVPVGIIPSSQYNADPSALPDSWAFHATECLAYAGGGTLGVCKQCALRYFRMGYFANNAAAFNVRESMIDQLLTARKYIFSPASLVILDTKSPKALT